METRVIRTLAPGKLVREISEGLRKLLLAEAEAGEVIVSLLETASDEPLRGGAASLWVALTDRRALVLAADGAGDSFFKDADEGTVARRGRLGRDEITVGDRTLKCPLFQGGAEFKQFAALAAAARLERLRTAARLRLEERSHDAAAALAEAGLEAGADGALLGLKVLALLGAARSDELGEAIQALLRADPELTTWEELSGPLLGDSRALWQLYRSAVAAGLGPKVRALLASLRDRPPADAQSAELIIAMDADEGALEAGFRKTSAWLRRELISTKTFLSSCELLRRAGLDSEPFHRDRAQALAEVGNVEDALEAIGRALALDETVAGLRIQADLLLRSPKATQALSPLERLGVLGEDDAWISSRLAACYEAMDSLEKAVTLRERAIEQLLTTAGTPEAAASERRALAKLHRAIGERSETREREIRIACADLLERGLDWAARLREKPRGVLVGGQLSATVEVLYARTLPPGPTTVALLFEEELLDPKAEPRESQPPPSLLVGGVTGVWPAQDSEVDVVQTGKRSAFARYSVAGPKATAAATDHQRGLQRLEVQLDVPEETRPSYSSDKVRATPILEVTPPGARFPIELVTCHDGQAGPPREEEREGLGRQKFRAIVPDLRWSFGETGAVELRGELSVDRQPTSVEVALVATERLRPPHKGEREVQRFAWSFPVFPYEIDDGELRRLLRLDLPREGTPSGVWTWFELEWSVRVRLLRKDKPEATVEVPILLRYPPG